LHLRCYDGELFSRQGVHDGRFSHVGIPEDVYKTSFMSHDGQIVRNQRKDRENGLICPHWQFSS